MLSVLNSNFNKYNIKYILSSVDSRAFRPEGPQLVDFEKGDWVYIPEITKKLLDLLNKGKVLILKGKTATGKSVLTRYIGYHVLKSQKNTVYYFDFIDLDFKEKVDILNKLDDVSNKFLNEKYEIENKSPLLIFENIHDPELNDKSLGKDRFYRSIKALEGKIKIFLTTRSEVIRIDWIEEENKINLDEDSSLNHEIITGIIKKFNSKRIKDCGSFFEWKISEIPENLWLIGWNLRLINELKIANFDVDDLKNNERLRQNIEAYYSTLFSKHRSRRELIRITLLIISVLSRFETYTEEEFILHQIQFYFKSISNLNFENEEIKKILNLLSESKEIEQKSRFDEDSLMETNFYRIPHIKLAEYLYKYFSSNRMRNFLEKVLERYFKDGKNLIILGYNLWHQKEHKLAFKCFKFTKRIENAIKLFTRKGFCQFRISNERIVEMHLEKNKLRSIPFEIKIFEYLDSLNIVDNKVGEIQNLESLSGLKKLGLQNNEITEIKGLSQLNRLEELDLSANKIKEIKSLANLKYLKSLDLSLNVIKEIKELDNLTRLEELYISYNKIKEIKGLDRLKNLRDLDLDQNKIKEIKRLDKNVKLEELSIRDNEIETIKGLNNLKNLKILDLTNNKITEISGLHLLFNLTKLLLLLNQITKIDNLENNVNLRILNLSGNYIESIDGMKNLNKIRELDLSFNNINEIKTLKYCPEIEILDLSVNSLHNVKPLKYLKNLRSLAFSDNIIKDINHIKKLVQLNELFLGGNNITNIKFLQNFPHLQNLGIGNIEVRNLNSLKSLKYLRRLIIQDIKMIKGIEEYLNITDVFLSQKELTASDIDILRKLPNLVEVHFAEDSYIDKPSVSIISNYGQKIRLNYS
jgi:Leucine-rich repeat (LRR) protein